MDFFKHYKTNYFLITNSKLITTSHTEWVRWLSHILFSETHCRGPRFSTSLKEWNKPLHLDSRFC